MLNQSHQWLWLSALQGSAILLAGQAQAAETPERFEIPAQEMVEQAPVPLAQFAQRETTTPPPPGPPAPVAPAPEQAETGLGAEIIVTARRREENIQTVPISVTAISGEQLREARVTRVEDLQRIAPSLTFSPSQSRKTTLSITIRSQRENANYVTTDPAVGYYFAEAVQAHPIGVGKSMFDLESVQVLKGPQGTLFGRNTTGGAILVSPNRPKDRNEAFAELVLGSQRLVSGEAMVNVPVAEGFALRGAATVTRRRGFVRNLTRGGYDDGDRSESFRLSTLLEPGGNLSIFLVGDHYRSDQPGTGYVLDEVDPNGLSATIFPGLVDTLERQRRRDFHTSESDGPVRSRASNTGLTSIVTADFGSVRLKNVLAWRRVFSGEQIDIDGSAFPVLFNEETQRARQLTEELQLQGDAFDDRLTYVLGVFHFRETGQRFDDIVFFGEAIPTVKTRARNRSSSAFVQADYRILDPVRVTGGIRYTRDDRQAFQEVRNPDDSCGLRGEAGQILGEPCRIGGRKKFDAITYTVGADWQVSDRVFAYITHRRGYRSGGFDASAQTALQLSPFNPEQVRDIEVGAKTDWEFGGVRGRANLALFYTDYRDIQRVVTAIEGGVPVQRIRNAAQAKIRGGEFEFVLVPATGLEFSGFYALSRARYDQFRTSEGDFSGNRFAQAPDHMARLALRAEAPGEVLGSELAASADYSWRSETFFNDSNEPGSQQKAYGLAGLSVDLQNAFGAPISVGAFARNLFDQRYAQSGTTILRSLGYRVLIPGEPRTWGVRLAVRFGP